MGTGGSSWKKREQLSQVPEDRHAAGVDGRSESEGSWLRALDGAWRGYALERAARLQVGADAAREGWVHPDGRPRSAAWYEARANTARVPLAERLEECGQTSVKVRCRCTRAEVDPAIDTPAHGVASVAVEREVKVRCGLRWLCTDCKRKYYGRRRAQMTRALKAHRAASRRAWEHHGRRKGRERRITHVVLSGPHDGTIHERRERIRAGWEKLRKWMHTRLTRKGEPGQFPYAAAWEITPGHPSHDKRGNPIPGWEEKLAACAGCQEHGRAHPHIHVVALWPFEDWSEVQEEWARAMDCESSRLHLESESIDVQNAADYIAKYSSKGVQLGDGDVEFAARALDMQWGKRAVTVSRGFWMPFSCECPDCSSPYYVVERPPARPRWTGPALLDTPHSTTPDTS